MGTTPPLFLGTGYPTLECRFVCIYWTKYTISE